jgi:hypothetical protein
MTTQLSQSQIENKILLITAASILASISLPIGATEQQISLQVERWYQFMCLTALPDETVFTSPPAGQSPTPAAGSPPSSSGTAVADIQALAKAVAPLLSVIPGAGGQIASGVAAAIGNVPSAGTPLPSIQSATGTVAASAAAGS